MQGQGYHLLPVPYLPYCGKALSILWPNMTETGLLGSSPASPEAL